MQRSEPVASAVAPQAESPDGFGEAPTRRKLWIGGIAIFAAVGYLISTALGSGAVYYVTVAELQAQVPAPGSGAVRVAGLVVPGTITRAPGGGPLRFLIADVVSEDERLAIVYNGLVPDIFGDNIEVVVEGRYTDGQFEATSLLAKCPSKFEATAGSS